MLQSALGLPSWFDLKVEQRTRYESLDDDFRAGRTGSNQLFALRTLIEATVRYEGWRATGELQDSRQWHSPKDAFLDTSIVNAVEPLQAFVAYTWDDLGTAGDSFDLRVGRQTLDLGERRLVSRNRFRNTINSFQGVHGTWQGDSGPVVQAFWFKPVTRLPDDADGLQDNKIEIDETQDGADFLGIHSQFPLGERSVVELHGFYLDESDRGDEETRDRNLVTVGARVNVDPAPGEFSFEWESAFQFGDSRTTTAATNTTDLDHKAHFHHLEGGYQFEGDSQTQVLVLFDYASGDEDPADGENNRFDTLFGARRWEWGPTGIFGAFTRVNIVSPGAQVLTRPFERTTLGAGVRMNWLAAAKDAWVPSGLRDPTGDAGRYVGEFFEVYANYELVPKFWDLEVGMAYLAAGSFIDDAPNNTGQGDSTYVYGATRWRF